MECEIAVFLHVFDDLRRILAAPEGGGDGDMDGLRHLKARLQVIHHQKVSGGEVVCLHDGLQGVGVGLADGVILGKDQIRADADVQVVVPQDIVPARKRCHADEPASALLFQDDLPDALADRGNVGLCPLLSLSTRKGK